MNANRPIDSKREEYRKYLERAGVLDALTKLLAHLYEEPEKPTDGLKFIFNFFGESFPELFQQPALEAELNEQREKVKQLTDEVNELKAKLAEYEKTEKEEVPEVVTNSTRFPEPDSVSEPVAQ